MSNAIIGNLFFRKESVSTLMKVKSTAAGLVTLKFPECGFCFILSSIRLQRLGIAGNTYEDVSVNKLKYSYPFFHSV